MKTITGPITTEEADERLDTTHRMIGNVNFTTRCLFSHLKQKFSKLEIVIKKLSNKNAKRLVLVFKSIMKFGLESHANQCISKNEFTLCEFHASSSNRTTQN